MTAGFFGGIHGSAPAPPGPGWPGWSLSVQVAFNDNVWATSPTWTDITQYATKVTTTMGRQHELQQVNPSTATIELDNRPVNGKAGGRFSPWNTASPYYNSGNGLTPGHPVRIQATISGTTYNVFYGYTKSWVPSYSGTASSMVLNCYDGMALLNLALMDQNLYVPQVLADGATAYWQCQDTPGSRTFADATGNGNTGLLVGTGTFGGTAGALRAVADGCVTFGSSTTTGAGVLQSPIGPAGVSHVMFEAWFQTTGTSQTLMSWDFSPLSSSSLYNSLAINSSGFPVVGAGAVPTTGLLITGGTPVNDGNWHHYVVQVPCTDVTGTWSLWVDGNFVGSAAGNQWTGAGALNFVAAGDWVRFGSINVPYSRLTGAMDHVAYYQTPLSTAQIAKHYALGSAGFVLQDSGARVAAVLENLAGIPSGLVNCDTGVVQVQGATSSLRTSTVSSYLQQIVNTERGLLYQDTQGVLQFKNRWHVYTNLNSVNSQFVFTYDGTGQGYYSSGLVPGEDDTDLWNDINVGRQGGTIQNASSSSSITKNGRRSLQGYTSLLFAYDFDALDLAMGLVYQYANPQPRVRAISTSSIIGSGTVLPLMLALSLLDRFTVVWRPIDGSSANFSQASLLEQITHTIVPGQWDITSAVTPIGTEVFAKWGTTATWGGPGWAF